jgi:hypothetical protein
MNLKRREFIKAGVAAAALTATTGCDQAARGRGWLFGSTERELPADLATPGSAEIDDAAHVLARLTFGAAPGDYARVSAMGARAFIEEQLAPEKIADGRCERIARRLETLDDPAGEMFEYKEKHLLAQLTKGSLLRAVASERQLYEVMVQFWTDHFNIDPSKGDCKWLKAWDDREVVRRHAMGRFSEMLRASALSPAMLWYLDGRVNQRRKNDDKPNENYARELMELHTLGVHGGYTQQDVMEVARCLTGWTVRDKKQLRKGKVSFDPKRHDNGAKTVLGHEIPAGLGEKDLDRVLEIVTQHPSTARYIASKLCRRFIADEPAEAAVHAVAESFTTSGGDVRTTLRTLFSREEFWDGRGNKLKRPFHYVVSALRATNARTDGAEPITRALVRMGHAPFRYPTPDGYPEESRHWTGTLLWRWNFAADLAANRIKGTRCDLANLRTKLGSDEALLAHCFSRQPTPEELSAYQDSDREPAFLFAAPAFQRC